MQKYDYFMYPEKIDSTTDIIIYNVGFSTCPSNYTFGWDTRDYYLIHYCISGRGTYQVENQIYHIEKNEGFLITPGSTIRHLSDVSEPWTLSWIGFHGKNIKKYLEDAGLDENKLIFRYDTDDFIQNCIENIYSNIRKTNMSYLSLIGNLYLLLGKLAECKRHSDHDNIVPLSHFEKVIRYINLNIYSPMTIKELAYIHNIEESHLYRIFKREAGLSPKQYLDRQKIEKACTLIKNTDLSFHEISNYLGYEYDTHFYKVFKKQMNMRPTEYKKILQKE